VSNQTEKINGIEAHPRDIKKSVTRERKIESHSSAFSKLAWFDKLTMIGLSRSP
jgi:hypothetical protein